MTGFYDAWGDPIEGDGWTLSAKPGPGGERYVSRQKPGAPGVEERVALGSPPLHKRGAVRAQPVQNRRLHASTDIAAWARPEDIKLRLDRESPIRLEIESAPRDTIVDEVLGWASDVGAGHETGGFIFGKRTRAVLSVTVAGRAGDANERSPGAVRLDSKQALATENRRRRLRHRVAPGG